MNMRGFVFSSLALALGVLTGCPGDDGGGTGDDTTGGATTGGMTSTMMTTMAMTTMGMDDGVDDGMNTTGEPPATTGGVDDTTGDPPGGTTEADTGAATDTGAGSESGTGGGALNCDAPADECQTCVCDMCDKQLAACEADPGCVAIRDCAAENNCTGLDCLVPCGDVINANGGPAGESAMLAGEVGTCVGAMCEKACAP